MAERTPIKAIRAKCMECSNNQPSEIKECPIESCALYEYRFGKRPGTYERQEAKRKQREADAQNAV